MIPVSLPVANFALCLCAGLLCVFVLLCRRVNTIHPLSLLFVSLTGLSFVVWMIEGMVSPAGVTALAVMTRFLTLCAFGVWVTGRVQCERGICQLRDHPSVPADHRRMWPDRLDAHREGWWP